MKPIIGSLVILLAVMALPVYGDEPGALKFADLGDFRLESGELIRDCKIGYRTFGALNADKSNAVLFPTWFSGKSEQLAGNFGPGRMIDTERFFVIAVDALGNGVSSSPSNSTQQPGEKFPRFTIRDLVSSQHQLVTRTLGLKHLFAVVGISMGGMQTFQWMTAYPDFMDRAVPIVGTTMQTAYDLLLWRTELQAIELSKGCADADSAMRLIAHIHALALATPHNRNAQTAPADFQKFIAAEEQNYIRGFRPLDWAAQLRAMMAHDISRSFAGSMEKAAAAVKAKTLVIVATQDHMVNPAPALEFAKLLKAQTLELSGDCGHLATGCENNTTVAVVRHFLHQK
ncbi:MAG TPA: alpha/beta fold hydrolase [Blastocatellia bacterium]|nr:alpha/beta fold hydrolase [Blastocatellia bacterium]